MARVKRSVAAGRSLLAELRARAAARVADHDARLAQKATLESEVYPFERFADRDRERLAAIDEGRPIVVGAWELPHGTEVPCRAWSYTLLPDGRLIAPEPDQDKHTGGIL